MKKCIRGNRFKVDMLNARIRVYNINFVHKHIIIKHTQYCLVEWLCIFEVLMNIFLNMHGVSLVCHLYTKSSKMAYCDLLDMQS